MWRRAAKGTERQTPKDDNLLTCIFESRVSKVALCFGGARMLLCVMMMPGTKIVPLCAPFRQAWGCMREWNPFVYVFWNFLLPSQRRSRSPQGNGGCASWCDVATKLRVRDLSKTCSPACLLSCQHNPVIPRGAGARLIGRCDVYDSNTLSLLGPVAGPHAGWRRTFSGARCAGPGTPS